MVKYLLIGLLLCGCGKLATKPVVYEKPSLERPILIHYPGEPDTPGIAYGG